MDRLDHTNLDFEQLAELCSPFVQDLVMYVIQNMHEELETFLKEHCRGVDDDEELHKHRYWDMFQDYSKLLESKLEVFVDRHNMTAHSFYDQLLEAQTEDPMASQIIQYLLGATEYRRFVDLLIDRKLFHFGTGGPIGAAVGADGSVLEGKTTDGDGGEHCSSGGSTSTSTSTSSDGRVRNDERGNSGSSKTRDSDEEDRPTFGRKESEERMGSSVGGKETDDTGDSTSRKK